MSFTWDESQTFQVYVNNGVFIDSVFSRMSANNHWLNTWLMILMSKMVGAKEFFLRLPNLLSYLIFMYFSARIIADIQHKILAVCFFVMINLNPYLLDFFCLARGYGLAMAFMMGSLFYAYVYVSKNSTIRFAFYSLLFAAISVISQMTLLNYFFALLTILFVIHFQRTFIHEKRLFFKNTMLLLLIPFVLLAFIVPLILQLQNAKAFFYGGDSGFWKDTVNSLIYSTLYEHSYSFFTQLIVKVFILFVLLSSSIIAVQYLRGKKSMSNPPFLFVLLFILFFSVMIIYANHQLFGIKFLIQRTGLFYIPLFNLTVVFLFHTFTLKKKSYQGISFLVAIFVIMNFIHTMNLNYVLEWKLDADTRNMMKDVEKMYELKKENITIWTEKGFDTPMDFYRITRHLNWLTVVNATSILDNKNEFYYGTKEGMINFTNDSLVIVKEYPVTKSVLAVSNH